MALVLDRTHGDPIQSDGRQLVDPAAASPASYTRSSSAGTSRHLPVPVDTTSVSKRLQKELMSLMMSGGDLGVSAFPAGESIFTWIGTIEVEKELCMRAYLTSSPCVFPSTTLSNHPKSSLRQCASIQTLISLATFVLTFFRTNGLQLMNAEPFFCPFRVYWESPTQRVLSTAMLWHCGTIGKITKKWCTNNILLEKHLKADR